MIILQGKNGKISNLKVTCKRKNLPAHLSSVLAQPETLIHDEELVFNCVYP